MTFLCPSCHHVIIPQKRDVVECQTCKAVIGLQVVVLRPSPLDSDELKRKANRNT